MISTQVFEYVSHPYRGTEEIFRVLKSGGTLLMSLVSCAPRFGDDERWRYTPLGIQSILSGFSEVSIVPETSSLGGLVRTLNLGVHTYAHFRFLRRCMELTVCPCQNLVGVALEGLKLSSNDQFTPNYSVRVVK